MPTLRVELFEGRTPQQKTVGDDTFTTFTWEKTDKVADLRAAAGL